MTPAQRGEFLAMMPRVFVRALRDPVGADVEFELSEGQATSLLRGREEEAYERGLNDAAMMADKAKGEIGPLTATNIAAAIRSMVRIPARP